MHLPKVNPKVRIELDAETSSVPRRVLNSLQEQKEYDMAKQLKLMYYELRMQLLNTCKYKEH